MGYVGGVTTAAIHQRGLPVRSGTSRTRHSFAQRIATLLVAANLAACYTWQPADGPLPRVVEDDAPSSILVVLEDGTEAEVDDPLIVGDTLYARARGQRPTAIAAVADVRHVDVPKTDTIATTLAIVGIPVLLLGVLVAASCCEWSE